MQYSNKKSQLQSMHRRVFQKKLQRCVSTNWSDAKLIGEKAKVKVATLQWTNDGKWTLSRQFGSGRADQKVTLVQRRRCRLTWTHEIAQRPRIEGWGETFDFLLEDFHTKSNMALLRVLANEAAGQEILEELQGENSKLQDRAGWRSYGPWPALEATFLKTRRNPESASSVQKTFFS